ncbi:MAG: hypothetical protein J0M02_15545, partial [Planctomycetes bacterium]|nr:hypothetical protein [Planctomycetota bacterium]
AALPRRHLDAIADWPLSTVRLRAAGAALCVHGGEPIGWGWPLLPLRNAVFFGIVLAHGLRRLWT